jgi:hypothetical protein
MGKAAASSSRDPYQPWPCAVLAGISVEAGRNRFLPVAIANLVFQISLIESTTRWWI